MKTQIPASCWPWPGKHYPCVVQIGCEAACPSLQLVGISTGDTRSHQEAQRASTMLLAPHTLLQVEDALEEWKMYTSLFSTRCELVESSGRV